MPSIPTEIFYHPDLQDRDKVIYGFMLEWYDYSGANNRMLSVSHTTIGRAVNCVPVTAGKAIQRLISVKAVKRMQSDGKLAIYRLLPLQELTQSVEQQEKQEPKVNIYPDNTFPVIISRKVYLELVKPNYKYYKPPDYQKWAEHVDRMVRLDECEERDIVDVIEWIAAGKSGSANFWQGQIRSTANLRKHFPALHQRMMADKRETTTGPEAYQKPPPLKLPNKGQAELWSKLGDIGKAND